MSSRSPRYATASATGGRFIPETYREVRGRGIAATHGEQVAWLESFRQSVLEHLRRVRYVPARIGSCAVRQLVEQPFVFRMER